MCFRVTGKCFDTLITVGDKQLTGGPRLKQQHKRRRQQEIDITTTRRNLDITTTRRNLGTTMSPPNIDPDKRSIAWKNILNAVSQSPRVGAIPPIDNAIDLEKTMAKLYGVNEEKKRVIIQLTILANDLVSVFLLILYDKQET